MDESGNDDCCYYKEESLTFYCIVDAANILEVIRLRSIGDKAPGSYIHHSTR